MAISNADTKQFTTVKNSNWYQTADSGDVTTYDQNTLAKHVSVTAPA